MPSQLLPFFGRPIFRDPADQKETWPFSPPGRGAGLLFFFLLLLARTGGAEPAGSGSAASADEGYELPPVVVIGERVVSEREVENRSKFMTIIDTRGASSQVSSPSEVLTTAVGVRVNQWGGLGGFSTVSIRGSSPSQVQVYIDGVPVNSSVTGVANLEDFPLAEVEYIEVFRGFTPADFGVAGIGGVINLVTRQDLGSRYLVSFSYGSFETYRFSFFGATTSPGGASETVSLPPAGPRWLLGSFGPIQPPAAPGSPLRTGPLHHLFFVGGARSRGDFLYTNDNGTPLLAEDDFEERRANNEYQSLDLLWRVSGRRGPWEMVTVTTAHWKDQGLPGLQSAQAEHTRLTTRRGGLYFSARHRSLAGGRMELAVSGDGMRENQVYDDPEGELGTLGPRKTENLTENTGARVKVCWQAIPDRLTVTGYVEYRLESFLPVEHVPETRRGARQSRTLLSTVIQAEVTDASGRWGLQIALREERYYNRFAGDPHFAWSGAAADNTESLDLYSPSLGLRYRMNDELVFKANAGRFYRVPTFYELFGDRGVALGNTSLHPEQGVSFDVGFTYTGQGQGPVSNTFLEYAYFQSRTTDLILFFQNSQRTVRPDNLSAAWIGGHELAFGLTLYDSFRLSGNYTYQSAVDQGEVAYWHGNSLPFRPMHEAYLRLDYQPEDRFRVFGEASYVSGNFWDRANLYEVPERKIYNLGASAVVWRRGGQTVSLTIEGKNLSDDRAADVAGYPLPGRSVYVTVQAQW